MRVLDAAGMREADRRAVARDGETTLMRRAGVAIAELARSFAPRRVVAFAGPGNNGGDAFAACAELAPTIACTVYTDDAPSPSDARRDAEARARARGVAILPLPHDEASATRALHRADLALDALLGIAGRNDTTRFAAVIAALNASAIPIVAVDLPTGVDATTGELATPVAVRATATLMLGAPKLGVVLEPGRAQAGEVWYASIGIDPDDGAGDDLDGGYHLLDEREFLALLPVRAEEADKRSAGAPLILAGSPQFPGAAVLCARGAARAGAGYVTVATPERAAPALRTHLVEQVVVAYDDTNAAEAIETLVDLTRNVSSAGIGPGMGLGETTAEIVRGFIERTTLPLVLDASSFAHVVKLLEMLRTRQCVLTPHASEFARLSGGGTIAPGTRLQRLRAFVEKTGVTTLLKGNTTLISDGRRVHLNPTGTNALATAGTGDVLTGMIATLLSQGLSPVDAARVGAYWHGRAGRVAAAHRSRGVIAGDLPELLAEALPSSTREETLIRRLF